MSGKNGRMVQFRLVFCVVDICQLFWLSGGGENAAATIWATGNLPGYIESRRERERRGEGGEREEMLDNAF